MIYFRSSEQPMRFGEQHHLGEPRKRSRTRGDRRARRREGWTTSARGMDDARETRRRVSVDDKPMFGDLIVNDAWCRESIGDLN